MRNPVFVPDPATKTRGGSKSNHYHKDGCPKSPLRHGFSTLHDVKAIPQILSFPKCRFRGTTPTLEAVCAWPAGPLLMPLVLVFSSMRKIRLKSIRAIAIIHNTGLASGIAERSA